MSSKPNWFSDNQASQRWATIPVETFRDTIADSRLVGKGALSAHRWKWSSFTRWHRFEVRVEKHDYLWPKPLQHWPRATWNTALINTHQKCMNMSNMLCTRAKWNNKRTYIKHNFHRPFWQALLLWPFVSLLWNKRRNAETLENSFSFKKMVDKMVDRAKSFGAAMMLEM